MSGVDELATKLKRAYENAGTGGKVVEIHLFAIRHAEALKSVPLRVLLERAGMSKSYNVELRNGMNLASHVVLK
jgi:hypothetical protein